MWALRLAVAAAAVGVWRWLCQLGESPLLEWLHSPRDVGGWGMGEGVAIAAQSAVGWICLGCGGWCLLQPHWLPAAWLAAVQVVLAWAMTETDSGFPVSAQWLGPATRRAFPLLTNSLRIAAPAVLAWWAWRRGRQATDHGLPVRSRGFEAVLRWALAVTFAAHGVEALQHNPVFVDLLLDFARRWLRFDMPEQSARWLLTAIGVMDVAVAVLCVTTRWRGVLLWMAAWGLVTALSRVAANGWFWWHDVAVRAPHFAVPLAIAWLADAVELSDEILADPTPGAPRAASR
ncbi:MAG: hypothetical protein CMJ58_12260 [Planctomycetaceae bacterium]|nr:hypothetical protein [Planctomycetaceae bacterium]